MACHTVCVKSIPGAAAQGLAVLMVAGAVAFLVPQSLMCAQNPSNTPIASSIKDLKMSPQELRIRVRALIRPVLGIIEENADQIIANTSNPVVRRGFLVWKIEMTTTMLSTMLRSDPVLALGDAWGYAYQTEAYLKRPDIKGRYGASADRALDALKRIDALFRDFVTRIQSEESAESFAATVRRWAEQTPIEGALYGRMSMDSALADALGTVGADGAMAALRNLDETTADVMARMDFYTMYLPRLARWEAELGADDLLRGVDPRKLNEDFVRLTAAADRIAGITETSARIIEKERIAAVDGIDTIVNHVFTRMVHLLLIYTGLLALLLALWSFFFKRK